MKHDADCSEKEGYNVASGVRVSRPEPNGKSLEKELNFCKLAAALKPARPVRRNGPKSMLMQPTLIPCIKMEITEEPYIDCQTVYQLR